MTTARFADRIDDALPEVLLHLEAMVRIPSVSALPEHAEDVARSARYAAELLAELGLESRVVYAGGLPSVIAHRTAPPGAPTVLLYAHHDVQPAGDPAGWASAPFEPDRRGGRLFGRGAADDKAGLAVHLAALLAHGDDLPVGVTVLVDGEEEIGSPTLPELLSRYRDELAADVIVVADSVNWAVGTPSLTVALRGLVDVVVELRTLEHALHSGAWGGPVPDALTALVATLASLHDADGTVAVEGLARGAGSRVEYDDTRFRADAGLLEGVRLAGRGSITDRLWLQPCLTVTAIDAPRVDGSANMLSAAARAKVSMRVAPGEDPEVALKLLTEHLLAHAPHGAHIEVTPGALAHPVLLAPPAAVRDLALGALRDAWDGAEPVEIGVGGTLPLIRLFTDTFPRAAVLVTGVEDPDTRAHGTDESLHLADFRNACLAEALLLDRLGR
ncbi:M20/M25/M40 family metallo-hydrolase [Pimelobacter simplex]|uniref:M20/M25/M40 family metallo-hydrolase n=1 Tax=Nocardioides simplex TaxID=2045 RepID=UPI0019325151|nr:M20/M25/M40 family metallo-hydrolase [Pimelobacter simplex]